ncbi:hypothetical protein [Actinomadura flavalba]|uniref:hypothetical protein n=1 Tax=Actinomadura flavalba TaxID=1120938 RepID=UPI00036A9085|nr:hypothetical protein [Actinomadura flavalba]
MIRCHVEGDGLGHLTRLHAYLHTLAITDPVTYVTSSPFVHDPRVTRPPGTAACPVTGGTRAGVAEEVVVDAFPAGRAGELWARDVPGGVRATHLARLLRWDVYRRRLPADPIRYDRTYVLEELHPEHLAYLHEVSREVVPLTLVDPPARVAPVGGWIVVHSGPAAEIADLVGYARDMAAAEGVRPELTVVAPGRPALPDGVRHLDLYPAWPLGATADRIVTAAGFNAVRQFAPWRGKHRVLPFLRTLDDQFARAARTRQEAGRATSKVTSTSSASFRAPRNAE